MRSFLKDPGEVIESVRGYSWPKMPRARTSKSATLLLRDASPPSRLQKGRYVKLYAQGHLDEKELDIHLVDLKNQVENLQAPDCFCRSGYRSQRRGQADGSVHRAWLLTLRERVEEVEEDTGEALEKRRKLVQLLVEQIKVDRNEDGHTQVQITYRFGPP